DVVVAGGGTAGVVAALAAARNGAKTLLIERYGFLGGMMTAGNAGLTKYVVHSTDPSDYAKVLGRLADHPSDVQIVGGIPMEITNELLKSGAGIGTDRTAGSYVFTSSEDFKYQLLTLLQRAGVKLLLHSWIVDVLKEGNTIKSVIVENKSGRQALLGKIIIDATGDGDVAARAGAPFTICKISAKASSKSSSLSAMGVMFKVGNVNLLQLFEYLKTNPDRFQIQRCALLSLADAFKKLTNGEMMTINIKTDFSPYFFQVYNLPMEGVVTLCCPCYHGDGTSAADLTRAEIAVRDIVQRWCQKIRKIPGFYKMYLLDCPQIGVRETRLIQGEYVLTIEDIFNTREFEDSIGRGAHPVDAPVPASIKNHPLPPRWSFSIPYRSLVAKNVDNLLLAGRCISVTHEAFGCTRGTVQCMITGEAAGTAATLCLRDKVKPKDLNIKKLRKKLFEQKVVL
ncbi:MAG: FAD-dependent oxidoreductase, partial [Verrucomicrobia bacterium]|nr:FAD-dependent oxidoreductase [Verrucomicrobiota bacterium]MBU1856726.1 FAD-dependent oxidoreductase [Verrucomicrobiota bacterium]